MRANTNIQTKTQKQLHLSGFKGVDFFSSPLNVQENRAADMVNFIHENGSNKKRNGWEQVIKRIPGRINMIYPYKNEGVTELLVYAGVKFYRITKSVARSANDYEVQAIDVPDGISLLDQKCQAFAQGNVIYLVGCGNYLSYLKNSETGEYSIGAVEPYIPITTIDIDVVGTEKDVRSTLEPVNLLTNLRKNKLVGNKKESTWDLGTLIDVTSEFRIEYIKETVPPDATYVRTETIVYSNGWGGYTIRTTDGEEVGEITTSGILKLNIDTTPYQNGTRNNLIITYRAGKSQSDTIRNCRFGITFGVGGAADRLFLSGNPDHKNMIWFSEVDNFAYFPDQYTISCGTDQQAITAFTNLNDNALAAFKEERTNEPSIYYISGEYRTTYSEDGEIERIIPVFSRTAGSANETAVGHFCNGFLEGENLFLSKNGVFSIELQENLLTNVRIARQKSLAVNPKLTKHNLSEVASIVYRGKYYLSVDGVCYVADSLYRYNSKDSRSTQYEWWYWEDIPARTWAEVNGELWFGTEEGLICRFTNDKYADQVFGTGEAGDFAINNERHCITYNAQRDYEPEVGDRVNIRTDGVFATAIKRENYEQLIGDERVFLTNGLTVDDVVLYEGLWLYHLNSEGIIDSSFKIADISRHDNAVLMLDEYGNVPNWPSTGGDFLVNISWVDLYISKLIQYEETDGTLAKGFTLKVAKDANSEIEFADVEFQETEDGTQAAAATNPAIYIYHSMPIRARWVTPVFDMGSNLVSKTLYKLTVSMDPESLGTLNFGFYTRFQSAGREITHAPLLDLDKLNLNSFTFEPTFWNSYTVKVKVPRFNYIQFWFESNTEGNCSIQDFTATYSITSRNLGVR